MVEEQQRKEAQARRGILARPLDALLFLAPLILFAELASRGAPDRLIASVFLRRFVQLFGPAGLWAPSLAVVVILLATQIASGQSWRVRWKGVGLMYVEAAALCLPLVLLNWAIPLGPSRPAGAPVMETLALCVGAGIYEELVFRLILLSLLVMIGVDLLRLNRTNVAFAGILLTSLAFAFHHYQPIGAETFEVTSFAFRAMAGGYLAVVFWYRGYGPAAGCHVAYNVILFAPAAFSLST